MMNEAAKILVVDDEANIRFFLEETLSKDGYQVKTAEHGEAALKLIAQEEFDLALIDLHMPGMGGDELASILHQRWPDTIIIILTAYATLDTAIHALRQGAHDYLFKPCKSAGIRESVRKGLIKRQQASRQRALLVRLEHELYEDLEAIHETVHPSRPALQSLDAEPESCLNWKNLAVDLTRHMITLNDQCLDLSPTEFALLTCLVSEAPGVISSQRLLHEVQGIEGEPWEAREIIRCHIYRIRQKAKRITGRDDLIRTVRGVGYTLSE